MNQHYRDDLAYIHDTGFGKLAEHAALWLIEELRRAGTCRGTVVELGCGGGISSRLLQDAGYHVVGIDQSECMIETARARVPEAEFRVGSFTADEIPPCVAVTAIGEVLNYTFDPSNCTFVREALMGRIYEALAPGGVLLFDLAGLGRVPSDGPRKSFVEGADWVVLTESEVDLSHELLTRRITTFRKVGDLYRRDFETHTLQLINPSDAADSLRRVGFTVQTTNSYGKLILPPGLLGFLARKPVLTSVPLHRDE